MEESRYPYHHLQGKSSWETGSPARGICHQWPAMHSTGPLTPNAAEWVKDVRGRHARHTRFHRR